MAKQPGLEIYRLHVNDLPNELFLKIFSYLNFRDLCVCSQVCHPWYLLTKDSTLGKAIDIEEKITPKDLLKIAYFHCTPALESLRLRLPAAAPADVTARMASKKMLQSLKQKCPRLRRLSLPGYPLQFANVGDVPTGLRHLGLRDAQLHMDRFFYCRPELHLARLACLDLGGVALLTSGDLFVLAGLASLRALYLDGCCRVNDGGLESLAALLPRLHALDLEGTEVSNRGAAVVLEAGVRLRELYLGDTAVDDCVFRDESLRRACPRLARLCVRRASVSYNSLCYFLARRGDAADAALVVLSDYHSFDGSQDFDPRFRFENDCEPRTPCRHISAHRCADSTPGVQR